MYRLFQLHLRGDAIGELECVRFTQLTKTLRLVDRLYREILTSQAADRHGHPAFLIGMVVNTRDLTFFPADHHQLEAVILMNEVPRVTAVAPKEEPIKRCRVDGILAEKLIY